MLFPDHVHASLPKWKFWTRMDRALLNEKGEAVARLKKSWAQHASVLDAEGNFLVKAKLQIGVKADLYDAKEKKLGSVKSLRFSVKAFFSDVRELWCISEDGLNPYLFLWPVEKAKVAHDVPNEVDIAHATEAYQIVKGNNVMATLVCGGGPVGFHENFDLVFEKGTDEGDRLLCTALTGYKVHNLLK